MRRCGESSFNRYYYNIIDKNSVPRGKVRFVSAPWVSLSLGFLNGKETRLLELLMEIFIKLCYDDQKHVPDFVRDGERKDF